MLAMSTKRDRTARSNFLPGASGCTDFFLFWFPGTNSFSEPLYFSSSPLRAIDSKKLINLKKGDVVHLAGLLCHVQFVAYHLLCFL